MQATISDHASFGDVLIWLATGLGAAVLILAFVFPGRVDTPVGRMDDDTLVEPAKRGGATVALGWVVGLAVVGLAAANMYYVFKAGDSGAQMVWSGYE
jgi:hypothetical protein